MVRLYWVRINEAGDYEIRSVTREGEAHSVTGGIFPKEGFEEHYEKNQSFRATKAATYRGA
jgi:hypothetical protein